jgi:hypothetical protein
VTSAEHDSEHLVRRFYDAWNRDGPEALTQFATAEVTLRDAPELPDAGLWRGRDVVIRRLDEVAAHVGGGWVDVRDVRSFNNKVLVRMEWMLAEADRGASVGDVFHVVNLDRGKITAIDVFLSDAEALAAATSPESAA